MKEYQLHPYCLAFPTATAEEFKELKSSINRHGIREPIVLLGKEILDGRNRYRAAKELKIPPPCRQYNPAKDGPDPLQFVIDRNIIRRHLTVGQRATLAVEMTKLANQGDKPPGGKPDEPEPGDQPDGDQPEAQPAGKKPTQKEASKALGVSERSVQTAAGLAATDPDRYDSVKQGKATLHGAAKASAKDQDAGDPDLLKQDKGIINPYRAECADMLAPSRGDKFAEAVRNDTVLRGPQLREFMKLTIPDQQQIAGLVAKGWKVKEAVKFAKGVFEKDDTIRDLLNLAIMQGGEAAIRIDGYEILVVDDKTLKMTEWVNTRNRIKATREKQKNPPADKPADEPADTPPPDEPEPEPAP